MTDPCVRIRFDGNGRAYRPGEILSGEYRLEGIDRDEIRSIEVSTLWCTEGKGDEDLSVHEFRRIALEEGDTASLRQPGRFSAVLPNSPLSYRGAIVKIRWCVRVRVFLARGREVVGEREFQLGEIPAVRVKPDAARALGPSPLAQPDLRAAGRGSLPRPRADVETASAVRAGSA